MPWTTTTPIIIWAITTVFLYFLLWFKQPDHKLSGLLFFLDFLLYYVFWLLCVNWVVFIYWIWLLPIPFFIVLLVHLRHRFDRPSWVGKVTWLPTKALSSRILLVVAIIITLCLGYLDFRVILSFEYKSAPGDPLLLYFPVRQGAFVIANGGNANHGIGLSSFYKGWFGSDGNEMNAYAVDVVELRSLGGVMSKGTLPDKNFEYKIYDDPINGPCLGTIVYVEDGHPEVMPFTQPTSELGNYIVIQCSDSFVTLANLKNGSIKFQPGERINFRVWIANVGNSGTPSIPHLRIIATRGGWRPGTGSAIPILFDGAYAVNQFATRNKIFVP